jgi:hypothetical protein
MRCPDCGAESEGDCKFCPRCGYAFDPYAQRTVRAYPSNRREGSNTVLIVVIVVIVVAVLVIAPMLLYVMVIGFGPDEHNMTPAAAYSKASVEGGVKITILSITRTDIPWDDIRIQMSDGSDFAGWSPKTAYLDGGAMISMPFDAEHMGTLSLTLTVTDLAGNGIVNGGDYFVVTANPVFSSATTYNVGMIYLPTGERMGTGVTFTG